MQQEIPLTQKIYDFYRDLYLIIEKMPKRDKYSIGLKIDKTTLDLLESVIKASSSLAEEKQAALSQASVKTDILKLLIRLAYDIKTTDQKKYLKLEEQLQEIGKMIGGWIKSLR